MSINLPKNFSDFENKEIPIAHGNHALVLNSGFISEKDFKKAFIDFESLMKNSFQDSDNIFVSNFIKISQEKEKNFINSFNNTSTTFVKHGGGSIFEYCLLANKLGQKEVNITVHEPREILKYQGEEVLEGIPRGNFAFKNINWIKKQVKPYEKDFGLKINFILEHENPGSDLKPEHQWTKNYYHHFDKHILSTHNIPISPDNFSAYKQNFIDGTDENFDEIFNGHQINENQTEETIIKILETYIQTQINHVINDGKKGYILGHCNLISCKIFTKLINLKKDKNKVINLIKKIYQNEKVTSKYKKLFELVKEKEMSIDLNIKGSCDQFICYEDLLFDLLKETQVPLVIGSDAHNLKQAIEAEGYYKSKLLNIIKENGLNLSQDWY